MTESNQLEAKITRLEKKIKRLQNNFLKERKLNGDLRHFIEDRIMDDKGWRIEYEAWLNDMEEAN